MEENDFCKLNMADRDRIRRKVIDALKKAGYDEGSMKLDESFVLGTEEGELPIPIEVLVYLDREAGAPGQVRQGQHGDPGKALPVPRTAPHEKPMPFAIVATEREAVVFDTTRGKTVGRGYGAFPSPEEADQRLLDSSDFRMPPATAIGEWKKTISANSTWRIEI